MQKVTIGIDIGGTGTKFGLVNMEGKVLFHDKIDTADYKKFDEYIDALSTKIKTTMAGHLADHELIGIGVGAPNGNYFTGTVSYAPNLPWKGVLPISDSLTEKFGVPTVVSNDANAAAVGEHVFGGAKKMKDFIMVTLGTGLGSGFVSNGQLVIGHDALAGEMGHIAVKYGRGRSCKCGKKGCLETYVSATGINRTIFKLLVDSHEDSVFRGVTFNELTTKEISQAADNGDKIAIEAFRYTGKVLGAKLADMVTIFNPEAIFLFGGLSQAGDHIFKPTIRYMEKNLMKIYKDKVQVLPSELGSQGAPIIGAASLVWSKLKS
ncbi:MAG: ROK family protein [Cyclobacteriaceae bacterium]